MSMIQDSTQFYDGWIYSKTDDPGKKVIRDIIVKHIEPGSSVIDIGCGTGALAFDLAEKCGSVTGLDLSSKMLRFAERRKAEGDYANVEFLHKDAAALLEHAGEDYDTAVMSVIFHEMPVAVGLEVLDQATQIAKNIVVADYITPLPMTICGISSRFGELFAGIEHYRGFAAFHAYGGLPAMFAEVGLKISSRTVDKTGTFVVLAAETESRSD